MLHISFGDYPFYTSFETKLRFDIGLYELKSASSSVGFLSLGRTIACF